MLVQVRSQAERQSVRLNVLTSFIRDDSRSGAFDLCVLKIHMTVCYADGKPVMRLGSEHVSVGTTEDLVDPAHLFCVTAFHALPIKGTYEISVANTTCRHGDGKAHRCIVYVARVARLSCTIEIGQGHCGDA
jgi:hypothetical protein